MNEKTVSDCFDEMYVTHLYVIEMRMPAMYWSGIILYLGQLTGYSEWTTTALELSDALAANFRNSTQKQQVMVLPLREVQVRELLRFVEREIPGAVSIYTLNDYYYEKLGKSFSETFNQLYYGEDEE